jgi:hypothetical protein
MGMDRDSIYDDSRKLDFKDPSICKYNLVGFCPFQEFLNTKSDIGRCKYAKHEGYLRDRYQGEERENEEDYERELMLLLEDLLIGTEKRKVRTKEKLKSNKTNASDCNESIEEQMNGFECQLYDIFSKMEVLGMCGRVKESFNLIHEAEQIRGKLERLREQYATKSANENKMTICEVCGALLILNETQKRLSKHYEGKLHRGFVKLRNKLADLLIKYNINAGKDYYMSEERFMRFERSNPHHALPKSDFIAKPSRRRHFVDKPHQETRRIGDDS